MLAAALAGCELLPVGPSPGPDGIVFGNWVWPTAAPLPAGAMAVPIDATPPRELPANAALGCPMALLGSIVAEYRAGEDPPVRYRQGVIEVGVVWPAGFSARLNPRLEVVAPDGTVFAREGEPTQEFGGGMIGAEGDKRFWICMFEYGPRRIDGTN